MEEKHISEWLPEYLDNSLDIEKKNLVQLHLKECKECSEELEELKELFYTFKKDDVEVPSDRLRASFLEQIEIEKAKQTTVVQIESRTEPNRFLLNRNFLRIAASIVLVSGSFWIGQQYQNNSTIGTSSHSMDEKIDYRQTAMLSLMGNKSASKRIQGVNFIDEFDEPDEAIVSALADRMVNDENTNVRRTAVEVLSGFTASEIVKNSFIRALKTEKDPGIQIAIIQILGDIQEKKALMTLQDLLKNEDTQPYVKDELNAILPKIL